MYAVEEKLNIIQYSIYRRFKFRMEEEEAFIYTLKKLYVIIVRRWRLI